MRVRISLWIIILLMIIFTVVAYDVKAETNITELQSFLEVDKTNEHEYLPWYSCGHFTRDLARNATEHNISLGGAICGTHPVFRGHKNHIINYIEINNTLYFIEPQTDEIMQLDEVFMQYQYIRLYQNGTQIPTNWRYNLAPSLRATIQ